MKQMLAAALALTAAIAAEVEKATGEKVLEKLDLSLENDLPSAVHAEAQDSAGVLTFNSAGFSTETDAIGRVLFRDVELFVAQCAMIDPVRAARIPRWFYWPGAYQGPNAAKFPSDDARELAWLNFNDRWYIHPYLGVKNQFAFAYARAVPPPNRPVPPSMLEWRRAARLTDTKAYDWGFTDAGQPLRDAKEHWEQYSHEDMPTGL